MQSKSHFLIHFIPGILLGSVVGLAFGSLLVASQIPHSSTSKNQLVATTPDSRDGDIVAESCDNPLNSIAHECLFLRKGDYLPIGTGVVSGRYLGIQQVPDAWDDTGKPALCPVFEIDGGSELIIDGLKKMAAAGSGVVPMKDGKFLWRMGTELPKNMVGTIEAAVKVYVTVPPQPEAGVATCYSPFVPVLATEMY